MHHSIVFCVLTIIIAPRMWSKGFSNVLILIICSNVPKIPTIQPYRYVLPDIEDEDLYSCQYGSLWPSLIYKNSLGTGKFGH